MRRGDVERGHVAEGVEGEVEAVEGVGVGFDEGVEEGVGEKAAFLCEGLVEREERGEVIGLGEFCDECCGEGFGGMEVFAGGVEVEEVEGGGRVCEGG